MPRFFIDETPQGDTVALHGENAHHAGRVLRLRPGEALTLCDGAGTDFDCTVEPGGKGRGRLPRAGIAPVGN